MIMNKKWMKGNKKNDIERKSVKKKRKNDEKNNNGRKMIKKQ